MKTQYESLLSAAAEFGSWFTPAELVVAAWLKEPGKFGLRGYLDYPDSNRVLAAVYGKKGLVGRGWLEKDKEGRLRVTAAGRREVARCDIRSAGFAVSHSPPPSPAPTKVSEVVIGPTAEEIAEFTKGNCGKAVRAVMRRARVCGPVAEKMLWEGVGA